MTNTRVTRNYGTNGDHGTVVAIDGDLTMVRWDHTLEDGESNTDNQAYWHPSHTLTNVMQASNVTIGQYVNTPKGSMQVTEAITRDGTTTLVFGATRYWYLPTDIVESTR